MNPWAEYKPSDDNPWTLAKVGHLYRRAAFGATLAELEAGVADGPAATVQKFLDGTPAPADYAETSDYLASERALPKGATARQLAAWWLARIVQSPHPLREKITLFWHNHFATSHAKVQNARYLLGQYRLEHEHALGDFRKLLTAMTTDPAMMVWLDTVESHKGKPNENYARELMELFSLGIGHYTEADVRAAARAFTGYEVQNGVGKLNAKRHDKGEKTVLGKTGPFRGDDVVRLCLGHPACPRFIVRKMYRYLVSEAGEPAAELIEPLATQYRESGFDTGKLVATILRSEQFYSPAAYRQKVKSPVEFLVGIVRGFDGEVGPLRIAEALESLGQALFAPPSVKGWDGGAAWLNAQTLLFRQNLALGLTSTEDGRFGTRCDPAKWLAEHGAKTDEQAADKLATLLFQGDVPAATKASLTEALRRAQKPARYYDAADAKAHKLRAATHLALCAPEYQLN